MTFPSPTLLSVRLATTRYVFPLPQVFSDTVTASGFASVPAGILPLWVADRPWGRPATGSHAGVWIGGRVFGFEEFHRTTYRVAVGQVGAIKPFDVKRN